MGSRRDFLKKAIFLSGAAGFSGVLSESIQRAVAIEPELGTSYLDAEHIVILMQENRSFDHMFGTLRGVRGFNDPRALRLANGNSVFLQTSASGQTYAPWRLDIKDTRVTWMGSLPHSRQSQVDAWNGGNHDAWIEAKRSENSDNREYANVPMTMGHYTREDIPFYYALADAFTVCDQHYCSVMTCTHPNRSVFWTGTVRDEQNTQSKVFVRSEAILAGGLTWTTYPERLQKAGISWKCYQNDLEFFDGWNFTNFTSDGRNLEERAWLSNFTCNILEFFANYHVQSSPRYQTEVEVVMKAVTRQIEQLQAQTEQGQSDPRHVQRELQSKLDQLKRLRADHKLSQVNLSQVSAATQGLHKNAFVTNASDPDFHALETITFHDGLSTQRMTVPKGDLFHEFREDVDFGKLPTISWLVAPEKFCDHPNWPWYGAWYVSEVMDILTRNPEVWKKTIFILTYDENDGYFDHAPSFVAADPHRKETGGASAGINTGLEYSYVQDELEIGAPERDARSGPIGLGFRVPMIVASPWTRGGWVNSQVFDHTSTLQFLEAFVEQKCNKQVRETNISAWRRAICGDLTSAFRPYNGEKPTLPFLDRNKFVESIQRARYKEVPSNYRPLSVEEIARVNRDPRASQLISAQEPGIRPSCAIPYEIYAEGHLSAERNSFQIQMNAGNKMFGKLATGSPFNVYLYGTKNSSASKQFSSSRANMMAATYAIEAGDTLKEAFALTLFTSGKYDIAIHGPNGFFRAFTGGSNDPMIEVACIYQPGRSNKQKLSGNVELHISHKGGNKYYTIQILDMSYKGESITREIRPASPKSIIVLPLNKQYGWYDFCVKAVGFDNFEKRYAGHVETGQPSYSDPLLGCMLQNDVRE